MKMTIIMNDAGELVAAQQGDSTRHDKEAGLIAGPGQKLYEVDVPDHLAHTQDPHKFLSAIKPHLPKA